MIISLELPYEYVRRIWLTGPGHPEGLNEPVAVTRSAGSSPAGSSAKPSRSINKTKGKAAGRKATYQWGPIMDELRMMLMDDGVPEPGDGGQAKLESFVKSRFSADYLPSRKFDQGNG